MGAPPYFPPFLHRWNKFGDFLCASLEDVALKEQILYCTQKRKELASSGAKSHKSRPPFGKTSEREAMKVVPL